MSLRDLIIGYLLYFLFPLWLVAGIADYVCHRRTSIEYTSGRRESALHVVQAAEIAVPLLAGLFLEINALVIAVMIVFVIAHSLTAIWDASYTAPRRYISPFEQHVHSHLEYIPIIAVSMIVLLYWQQLTSPSFEIRLKARPIPARYTVVVLGSILAFQASLLLEELLRTLRRPGRADVPHQR